MSLQNLPSEIMQVLLTSPSGSLFTLPVTNGNWPLYVTNLPDGTGVKDEAAAVYDTEGRKQSRLLASGRNVYSYGIQLVSRSFDPRDGFMILKHMAKTLETARRQIVVVSSNSYQVDTIIQTSTVIPIGQDERRRTKHSINFLLMLIDN